MQFLVVLFHFLQLVLEALFIRWPGLVDEKHAVEVVQFVLDGAGGQAFGLVFDDFAIEILRFDHHLGAALDGGAQARKAETAFVGEFSFAGTLGYNGVYEYLWVAALFRGEVDDDHAQAFPDLGGGQADAVGVLHRFDHVGGELAQGGVDKGNRFRDFAQNRVWVDADGENGHGCSSNFKKDFRQSRKTPFYPFRYSFEANSGSYPLATAFFFVYTLFLSVRDSSRSPARAAGAVFWRGAEMSSIKLSDQGGGKYRLAIEFTYGECERLPFNILRRIHARLKTLPGAGLVATADFNIRVPIESNAFLEMLDLFGDDGSFPHGSAADTAMLSMDSAPKEQEIFDGDDDMEIEGTLNDL